MVLDAPEQLKLFDEAEKEADPAVLATGSTEVAAHKRKAKRTHEELAENLPVEEVLHPVEDRVCEKCGSEMVPMGKEKIRDELVYLPAKLYVRRHFAEVVKCVSCGKDESRDSVQADVEPCSIRKAAVPEAMLPHSFCSPNCWHISCMRNTATPCPFTGWRKTLPPKECICPGPLWPTEWFMRPAPSENLSGSR